MNLGVFSQNRDIRIAYQALDAAGITVDLSGISADIPEISVPIEDFERASSILETAPIDIVFGTEETRVNTYDFPTLTGIGSTAELVPESTPLLTAIPTYFCAGRATEAQRLGVRIAPFCDRGDYRLYYSPHSKPRVTARGLSHLVEGPATLSVGDATQESFRLPARTERSEPIDVVFTAVDGADPAWYERFMRYRNDQRDLPELEKTQNSGRYTSHGELRYAIRSVFYYLPFVRTIYLVTDRQVPSWLNQAQGDVVVVDHSDIMDRAAHHPTFNSDALESHLWKIPNLSERFLYFNDDVFVMRSMSRGDFFTLEGYPKFFASNRKIPAVPAEDTTAYTSHAHIRTAQALERGGYGRPDYKFQHAPFSVRRSQWQQLTEEFGTEIEETRRQRFRSPSSYATMSFLYPHYALASGGGVLGKLSYRFIDIAQEGWEDRLDDVLARTNIDVACINESADSNSATVDILLMRALRRRFPRVPGWEEHDDFPSMLSSDLIPEART